MKVRANSRAVLFPTLVFLITLMLLSSGVRSTAAEEEVKLGYLGVISFAPVYIAEENGYLKEEGLKVDYSRFVSGAKMAAPLATGQLNVAAGSVSAGFFNAVAGGADILVVADKGQSRAGHGFTQLVVRKDLIDSGKVKSIKDLKGLILGLNAPMNVSSYWVGKAFEEAGFTLKDMNIKYISFPKQLVALKNKAVDVVSNAEPWGTRLEKLGVGVRFYSAADVAATKELQVATIMYNGKFARQRRATAQKYMNAYVKAVRFVNKHGVNDQRVLEVLNKWTKVPVDIIKATVPFYLDKDAVPNVKSIGRMQDFFHQVGSVKKKSPITKFIDLSFVKNAAAKK